MIGNIKNIINAFIIAVIFSCCSFKAKNNTVNIFINPQNCGWYFIELNEDSSATDLETINVRIDSVMQLKRITISKYEKFAFSVYDGSGTKISSRMKLQGYLSHHGGKTFLEFYNPTEHELTEMKKWNPTEPNYIEIVNKGRNQLNTLLERN
ncbi:hypothetical protein [Chitinophaga sp. CF418]|uniref:hypothetical protein n=1 Tax=Chitinophaga sp. CF418 TaxID=1855287 RepID=UPI0009187E6E|nr:hypothetical protein [Chitinophaga sp. CF418]SHM71216.1 hypothetical protein SAMN05216311_10336 [Chitinophaga sp. CF418]